MNKYRVLVVEHDAVVSLDLLECLVEAGYEVASTRGRENVLRAVDSVGIDLAILDADSADAPVVAEALHSRSGASLMYLTTASQAERESCRHTPYAVAVIEKPFHMSEIIDTVARSLNSQDGQDVSQSTMRPLIQRIARSHAA